MAILLDLIRFGVILKRQLVLRHWVYRGIGPSSGYKKLNQMEEDGLLTFSKKQTETRGRPPQVVSLSRSGWRELRQATGREGKNPSRRADTKRHEDYMLQRAQVLVEREARGWKLLKWTDADDRKKQMYDAMIAWAIERYDRREDATGLHMRRSDFRSRHPWDVGADLLWHPQRKEVRYLLPSEPCANLSLWLKNHLPREQLIGLFFPIPFEPVLRRPHKLDLMERKLLDWIGKRNRDHVELVDPVSHFLSPTQTSPNRIAEQLKGEHSDGELLSMYQKHGVRYPHDLLQSGSG